MAGCTLLVTFLLSVAAVAAAQPHGATPQAAAADAAPADAHAPSARQPARPAPVVSRITAAPRTAAGPAGHSEPDAHAALALPAKKGYVPVGASRRTAPDEHRAADAGHAGAGKPKPLVSGASALAARAASVAPDEHAAPRADHDAVSPAPDVKAPAVSGSTASPGPATHSRKPVRLAEVHGRLAAALAEARKDSGGATAEAGDAAAELGTPREPPAGNGASMPRLQLTWPEPRWSLTWPADGRLPIAWPPFGPSASSVPREPQ